MSRGVNMNEAFNITFPSNILEGQAVVGRFDGKHPQLCCGTTGQKVMVHSAHSGNTGGEAAVKHLNIGKPIKALGAFNFGGERDYDVLLIGSETMLQSYSVEQNVKIFDIEVSEGISTMCTGSLTADQRVVLVGGKCSIQGFSGEGTEQFWTVASDTVSALALLPWEQNSASNVLVSGSEDNEIRAFRGEQMIGHAQELSPLRHLVGLPGRPSRFAYGISTCQVGVYEGLRREWRAKTKHAINALAVCDVDYDGVHEVLCGWANGKFDVRTDQAPKPGEILFKQTLGAPVTAIVSADYRMDGREAPMVCTHDGQVRGFVAVETSMEEAVEHHEQQTLENVMNQKKELEFEIQHIDKQLTELHKQTQKIHLTGQRPPELKAEASGSAPEIKVTCGLKPNDAAKALDVVLKVSGGATIHSAVLSADIVFGTNDHILAVSDNPSDVLTATIALEKNHPCEVKAAVMVQMPGSDVLQVHDHAIRLNRFTMYAPMSSLPSMPAGNIVCRVGDKTNRVHMWAQQAFSGFKGQPDANGNFSACFASLRDGSGLAVVARSAEGGELRIHCDSMTVVGEIVQDLGGYLDISELQSTAEFPKEFEQFDSVLVKVDDYNAARTKFSAEMADSTQLVKSLVIRAEDARILSDMRLMRKTYGQLYDLNRELMGEFMKRSNNHTELLAALKEVTEMIKKAGNLRLGQAKATLVTECREAIRTNNIHSLFNIIRTGHV